MKERRSLKSQLPNLLAGLGVILGGAPYLMGSLYTNIYLGAGFILLFFAWIMANLEKKEQLIKANRWKDQVKAMIAMSACVALGLGMLIYYESQMPKYKVAMIDKELYRVPPQLNAKELRKMGADCNTYGDTLCSHAVFGKLVKSDPRDFFALANLAMAQTHLGFHENAVINFDRAIKNGVRSYDVYRFYGRSLLNLGKKKLAVRAYKASLKLNPYQKSVQNQIQKLSEK